MDAMTGKLYDGETFGKEDHSGRTLPPSEYDGCTFQSCTFTESDLGACRFMDCRFESCDLSAAKLEGTALQDVVFKECKLLGAGFDKCNALGLSLSFLDCQLDQASFYQLKLNGIRFQSCSLREADFALTQLKGASFEHCDLRGALFERTLLEEADLRTATGYHIHPEHNLLSGARFSLPDALALLHHLDIHIES